MQIPSIYIGIDDIWRGYKMKKLKFIGIMTGIVITSMVFAGCGSNSSSSTASKSNVKKIIVGTGNSYKPYCYLDDKNNPTGFDVELLKEVDKRLPQYEFEYQTSEFKNVLISLDAKKIDIAAHEYEKNPEREEKYLYGKEGYVDYSLKIAVKKGRTDIKTIDDLKGKSITVSQGGNSAYIMEQYNKKNGNAINLVYGASDDAVQYNDVATGRVDAILLTKSDLNLRNKAYGDKLEFAKDSKTVNVSYAYFIFDKTNTQLQEDVDGALKSMKEDGTISKLSKEILDDDYTKSE
jgi:L-cystine transport system substrate-binding protein